MPAKTATKTPKETKPKEEKETKPVEVKVDAGSESETETKPTKARKSKKTEESASESENDAGTESESEKPTKKKTAGRKKKETEVETAAPIKEEDEVEAEAEDAEIEFFSSEVAPFINLINGNVVEFIKKVKDTDYDQDDYAGIMKASVGLTNNFNKLSILMANKWFKLTKEKKGTKTTATKEKAPRKKVDPENVAVNRPNDVVPAFLKFMGQPDGTKLSRKDVQNYIYELRGKDGEYTVKDGEGKPLKGNPFYINKGKLGDFFKLIKNEIVSRGITDDIVIKERTKTKKSRKTGEETTTTEVNGYIHEDGKLPEYIHVNHIMKYIGYVFTPATKA